MRGFVKKNKGFVGFFYRILELNPVTTSPRPAPREVEGEKDIFHLAIFGFFLYLPCSAMGGIFYPITPFFYESTVYAVHLDSATGVLCELLAKEKEVLEAPLFQKHILSHIFQWFKLEEHGKYKEKICFVKKIKGFCKISCFTHPPASSRGLPSGASPKRHRYLHIF